LADNRSVKETPPMSRMNHGEHPLNVSPLTPTLSPQGEKEADFRRLVRVKQPRRRETPAIGQDLVQFFKKHVQSRQSKFGRIADVWNTLIPSTLLGHTCLESFHAGTLKVLVDTAPHLYELKTVMLAGLEQQILLACKTSGLRKISMKIGRWYEGDDCAKLTFT
jgi:hypothetical protein